MKEINKNIHDVVKELTNKRIEGVCGFIPRGIGTKYHFIEMRVKKNFKNEVPPTIEGFTIKIKEDFKK